MTWLQKCVHILRLKRAMIDPSRAADSKGTSWAKRWAKAPGWLFYDNEAIEALCVELVEKAINMHKFGIGVLNYYDPEHSKKCEEEAMKLTFQERMDYMVEYSMLSKDRLNKMLKHDFLDTFVAIPHLPIPNSNRNRGHNSNRGQDIKAGRQLRKSTAATATPTSAATVPVVHIVPTAAAAPNATSMSTTAAASGTAADKPGAPTNAAAAPAANPDGPQSTMKKRNQLNKASASEQLNTRVPADIVHTTRSGPQSLSEPRVSLTETGSLRSSGAVSQGFTHTSGAALQQTGAPSTGAQSVNPGRQRSRPSGVEFSTPSEPPKRSRLTAASQLSSVQASDSSPLAGTSQIAPTDSMRPAQVLTQPFWSSSKRPAEETQEESARKRRRNEVLAESAARRRDATPSDDEY